MTPTVYELMDELLDLCSTVLRTTTRKRSQFRLPVPVDQQVSVTLWQLATNVEYRTIAALFGLGVSTVCTIVLKTCDVIAKHLLPQYIIYVCRMNKNYKKLLTSLRISGDSLRLLAQ